MDEEGALQWLASPEGAHVVLHISAPPTRFTLLKEWQEQGQGFATSQPKGAHSDGGKILSVIPEPTGFRLRVEVTSPAALLRLADRYDPGIEVTVGNRPATALQPVDGLFCGTVLPSGIHDITLRNRISTPFAIAQPAGLLITAIALLLPAFRLQFFKEPPPE
jgi:hypothetical protein